MREEIEARLVLLKVEYEKYVSTVNVGLGEYRGRIAELERLLLACSNDTSEQKGAEVVA